MLGTLGSAAWPSTAALAAATPASDLIVSGAVQRGLATKTSAGKLDSASIVNASAESGARVSLQFFWAGNAKGGDTVPIREIATATTDNTGAYRLAALSDAELLTAAAQNDGWINFQLATTAGVDQSIEMLSRHWNGTNWDGMNRPGSSPTDVHKTFIGVDKVTGTKLQGTAPSIKMAAPNIPYCHPNVYHVEATYNYGWACGNNDYELHGGILYLN